MFQIGYSVVCGGTIAVSYTHLDVYKRQPRGSDRAFIRVGAFGGYPLSENPPLLPDCHGTGIQRDLYSFYQQYPACDYRQSALPNAAM